MEWDSLYGEQPVVATRTVIDFDEPPANMVPAGPVVRLAKGGVVPHEMRSAAETLLQWTDLQMNEDGQRRLERVADSPDDLVVVDPPVMLQYTVDTGSCRILLQEVVRVSRLLMLVALKATYTLQVTPKSRAVDLPFAEVSIVLPQEDAPGQPFEVEACLQRALEEAERADLELQVAGYMQQVGPLHPRHFLDSFARDEHVQRVRAIATGAESALEPLRKRIRDE